MPLYEYLCDKCGHRFEIKQGIKDDPIIKCPECKGKVRRVIHPNHIIFKGSGFYTTDKHGGENAK